MNGILIFLLNNKMKTVFYLIVLLFFVIGIYSTYSYFTATDTKQVFSGSISDFSNSDFNINYFIENRNSLGKGVGTYSLTINGPELSYDAYIFSSSRSSCTNDALYIRDENSESFSITSLGETTCNFYY